MARTRQHSGTVATSWMRSIRVGWALAAALLVCLGFAVPGPAASRPSVEWSTPAGAAEALPQLPAALRPRDAAFAAALAVPDDLRLAGPDGAPAFRPAPSRPPRDAPLHAYEATGPPARG